MDFTSSIAIVPLPDLAGIITELGHPRLVQCADRQTAKSSTAAPLHHPANGVISSRASGSVSNRPIAANSPSKLASDSGCAALRAQSRNLASSCALVSGFSGDPIGSLASTVTERPSVL